MNSFATVSIDPVVQLNRQSASSNTMLCKMMLDVSRYIGPDGYVDAQFYLLIADNAKNSEALLETMAGNPEIKTQASMPPFSNKLMPGQIYCLWLGAIGSDTRYKGTWIYFTQSGSWFFVCNVLVLKVVLQYIVLCR